MFWRIQESLPVNEFGDSDEFTTNLNASEAQILLIFDRLVQFWKNIALSLTAHDPRAIK